MATQHKGPRTKLERIPVRRCSERGCNKSIEHRGHRATRCEECAKKYLVRWRKTYDAKAENVAKRKSYDAKPQNVKKARFRRNKKIYLLGLLIRVLRLEGMTIDNATDYAEKKLRIAGRKPPISAKKQRGEALPVATHPWTTMRGKGKRKRRSK